MSNVLKPQSRRSLQIQRPRGRRFSPAVIKLAEDADAILEASLDSSASEGEDKIESNEKDLRERMIKNALRRCYTS